MSVLDVEQFNVSVESFHPSPDGATFLYAVKVVVAQDRQYTLEKRFSEFHALHNSLFASGFGAVPQPPPKPLTRPNDPDIACYRQNKLNEYIRAVCVRPDLRQSEPVIKFLGLDLIDWSPPLKSLDLKTLCYSKNFGHLSVVDCTQSSFSGLPLYVAAMADTTALSKFGRAWNVIEPETVGALCIYNLKPTIDGFEFGSTFSRQSQKRVSVVRFLIGQRGAHLLLAGDNSGTLSLYECKQVHLDNTELNPLCTREIHIKAPFTAFVQNRTDPFCFASVGGDNGLRAMRVDTGDCQITLTSAGRIKKPLAHAKETLSSLCLLNDRGDGNELRAVVGTNCGQVLIYGVSQHPSNFLGSLNFTALISKLENPFGDPPLDDCASMSYEDIHGSIGASLIAKSRQSTDGNAPTVVLGNNISHLELCHNGEEECLAVAIKGYIFILSLEPFLSAEPSVSLKLLEQEFQQQTRTISRAAAESRNSRSAKPMLLQVLKCPNESSARSKITAMCSYDCERFLFVSYQRGVTCWSLQDGMQPLLSIDMMRWGTVRRLEISLTSNSYHGDSAARPALLCATSLGGLRLLDLSDVEHWKLWKAGVAGEENPAQVLTLLSPCQRVEQESSSERTNLIDDECSTAAGGVTYDRNALRNEIYQAFRPARF